MGSDSDSVGSGSRRHRDLRCIGRDCPRQEHHDAAQAVRVRRRPQGASASPRERADLDSENVLVAWVDMASPTTQQDVRLEECRFCISAPRQMPRSASHHHAACGMRHAKANATCCEMIATWCKGEPVFALTHSAKAPSIKPFWACRATASWSALLGTSAELDPAGRTAGPSGCLRVPWDTGKATWCSAATTARSRRWSSVRRAT